MADNEQYRGQIDAILSRIGIDYRNLSGSGISKQDIARAEAWANANPNDPLAARIRANPAQFVVALGKGVKALAGQGDIFDPNALFGQMDGKPPADYLGISAPQEQQPGIDPNEQERQDLTNWITQFTQSLGRPLDMNDPVFASLSKMGAARASMGVGASGIRVGRGGLGEAAIQQGANNAVTPYLQQRQSMYQQGLGMLDSRNRGLEQLRQGAYGLNLQQQQMQNQVNAQMYGQQADAAGGTGGMWGGALGALAGVGATIATGGAAAGAIPGLIAGGSQIGAGLGQQSVARPQYTAPRPYGSFGNRGGGY